MKRIIALLFVLVLTIPALAEPLTELDVVLDWYPNALHAFMYVAEEKGYYAQEGLTINIRFPSNTNDALSLVAAGRADVGLYYQQDLIQARVEQDVPVKSIGAVVQGPLSVVLSLKEKGITSPKDLVGKTVGYAGTELSEAIVRTMMEAAGADPMDVTLIDVGFDLLSATTTGNVDATVGGLVNHEVPQLQEEGFEVNWFKVDEYGVPSYYEGIFLASDEMIDSQSDVLRAFLRASARGFQDVYEDPEGALEILLANQNAENFPLSEAVERQSLQILLPLMQTDNQPFLSQSDECWQANIDWMKARRLINHDVSLDDVRIDLM